MQNRKPECLQTEQALCLAGWHSISFFGISFLGISSQTSCFKLSCLQSKANSFDLLVVGSSQVPSTTVSLGQCCAP